MKQKRLPRNAIKEAFDNLPSGICSFSKRGIPVLCNRQMHRLVFALTGRDLQHISDLTNALLHLPEHRGITADGGSYLLPDGSVWCFASRKISAEQPYIEFYATNVTDLYRKKQVLESRTKEHEQMVEKMRSIVDNVEAITREEEILAMKMHVHGGVGTALQRLRRYHANGCLPEAKQEVLQQLEAVVASLMGEVGKSDETDCLDELLRLAESLDVTVLLNGIAPDRMKEKIILSNALRECITNTLRHAGGDTVTADLIDGKLHYSIQISNNGAAPTAPVVEGGGLGSLRRQVEKTGGSMRVLWTPIFTLIIEIPKERGEVE